MNNFANHDTLSKLYKVIDVAPPHLRYDDSHNVRTPKKLVHEILDQVDVHNKTILVIFNVEWMFSLVYHYGVNPKNITFYSDHWIKSEYAKRIGIEVINSLMIDRKFDIVVGNPPFSKGKQLLYPQFFKDSLDLAELVVMIMPYNILAGGKVKSHNKLLKTHSISISENITNHFKNVGVPDMRYIIASKDQINDIVEDSFQYEEILPDNARLPTPIRGMISLTASINQDPNGVTGIYAIHRGNKIIYKKYRTEVTKQVKKSMNSTSPWFVLLNTEPSKGLFNTAVIKNDGILWCHKVLALESSSEDEANKLAEWLVSDVIQQEVRKLLKVKGSYTISQEMIKKLPNYK
jgi:hypothetical protein